MIQIYEIIFHKHATYEENYQKDQSSISPNGQNNKILSPYPITFGFRFGILRF